MLLVNGTLAGGYTHPTRPMHAVAAVLDLGVPFASLPDERRRHLQQRFAMLQLPDHARLSNRIAHFEQSRQFILVALTSMAGPWKIRMTFCLHLGPC